VNKFFNSFIVSIFETLNQYKNIGVSIVNPEIAKYWDEALKAFNVAKVAFANRESDSCIIKNLWTAIVNGQLMTRQLNPHNEESMIAAGIAIESLSQLKQLGIKQAFNKVLQALTDYRNLVPNEYNLPLPIGLGK
jgi:hypothetical protein